MSNFDKMMEKAAKGDGFLAALDQSGGSTPKALTAYGVPEDVSKNQIANSHVKLCGIDFTNTFTFSENSSLMLTHIILSFYSLHKLFNRNMSREKKACTKWFMRCVLV